MIKMKWFFCNEPFLLANFNWVGWVENGKYWIAINTVDGLLWPIWQISNYLKEPETLNSKSILRKRGLKLGFATLLSFSSSLFF